MYLCIEVFKTKNWVLYNISYLKAVIFSPDFDLNCHLWLLCTSALNPVIVYWGIIIIWMCLVTVTNTVSTFVILWRKYFYVLCSHKEKKNYLRACSMMHRWNQYYVFLHVTLLIPDFDLLYLLITTSYLGIYPEHFFPSFRMDLSILFKVLHAFLVFLIS